MPADTTCQAASLPARPPPTMWIACFMRPKLSRTLATGNDTRRVALSASEAHHPPPELTMSNYRRNFAPGGTYFFTVNIEDRDLCLLTENIELLRTAFRYTHARRPFTTGAIVVLPDHLHAIWTLPNGDGDFSTRWMLIKSYFSRARKGRSDARKPSATARTRGLATPFLGTHDP